MIYTLTVAREFSASHELKGHKLCGRPHGHTFKVEVTVIGDPEPDTFNMVANDMEVREDLDKVLYEINYRNLNDMLPAVIASPQGVANWIWERLALRYQLHEVSVWQDDLRASLRRE